jgi:hypothetical protein
MEYGAFAMAFLGFIFSLYAMDEIKKLKQELHEFKTSSKINKKDK